MLAADWGSVMDSTPRAISGPLEIAGNPNLAKFWLMVSVVRTFFISSMSSVEASTFMSTIEPCPPGPGRTLTMLTLLGNTSAAPAIAFLKRDRVVGSFIPLTLIGIESDSETATGHAGA